jgi:DUF1365 family protein
MHSCLYNGWVRHRRREPAGHEFRYQLFMMYLDLAELPQVFDRHWLWSARRAAPARFKRSDYHGDANVSLDAAVRDTVERKTGMRPSGPIRMLTHLRYFGYVFNPVTFYYCFDEQGAGVETVLAEITNTPWKERHAYVLPVLAQERAARTLRFEFGKSFHVSPFWPMDMRYVWRLSAPAERLNIHMQNFKHAEGGRSQLAFDATLALQREEIGSAALAGALARFPLMTAQVTATIYWQALRLWLKKTPFFVHPDRLPLTDTAEGAGRGVHAARSDRQPEPTS